MGLTVICRSSIREQTLLCLDRLPKMSPLVTQLLGQLSRRNCDIQDLTQIVEKDPVLTGQILRLANSAVFGRLRPVASVRHAVAMVGVGALRKFALGSSISNLFSRTKLAGNFSMLRFNLHSVATATLVELLADEIPFESFEDAFLAGLLHDIGKLLIAASFPHPYENILALVAVNGSSLIEAEQQVLGIDHAELSGLAVSRWELSESIQWAACYHHQPDASNAVERRRSRNAGLSLGVHHADAFVNQLGMSVLPSPLGFSERPALEIPGISFSADKVRLRFEEEIKNLGDLFR